MSFKGRTVKANHLLSLMAILTVAIGVPLVHPILHDHLAFGHNHEPHRIDQLQCTIDNDEKHSCLICNFLTTNQLHSNLSGLPIEPAITVAATVFPARSFEIRFRPPDEEPRAPPLPHLTPSALPS